MDSLSRLIISVAALIAALSFLWIALALTETLPGHTVFIRHSNRSAFQSQ